ncbi:g1478 [Coccomyxa elongata]
MATSYDLKTYKRRHDNCIYWRRGRVPFKGDYISQKTCCSAAVSSSNNGATTSAGAVESTLLDANLLSLLEAVQAGRLQPEAAALQLRERSAGYQQVLDFAQVDSWRAQRTGFPEVVFGAGKSAEQIVAIMQQLAKNDQVAMATRVEPQVAEQVQALLPDVVYNAPGHILTLRATGVRKQPRLPGTVAIIASGTSDELVAEECRATADVMGCYCFRLSDVSVDGLHRILHNLPAVRAADVVVVISGTDGALPAVVAGLVEAPVIAVPTSVGYGAALQGLTPLLSALTASSPGVSVVNIDNGFGAGMLAARILRTAAKLRAQAAAATAASAYPNAG